MAVTLNVPEVNISSTEVHSNTRSVPNGSHVATVTLTSPSGQWDSKAGTGEFTWGMEVSYDAGANWSRLIFQTLTIGSKDRSGGMPQLQIDTDDLALGTAVVRLFASSTNAVRCGAQIVAS